MNEQDKTYNGWASRQTWNVALWLQNDYELYKWARAWWASTQKHAEADIKRAVRAAFLDIWQRGSTPDGVGLRNPAINWEEIAEIVTELCAGQ